MTTETARQPDVDLARVLDEQGAVVPGAALPDLDDARLIELYECMSLMRAIDLRLEGLQRMGRIGFFEFSEAARPELAFLLASNDWGHGYATEACRTVLSWAFSRHSWSECIALVRPHNAAAIRVCTKLGMKSEGSVDLRGVSVELLQVTRGGFEGRNA